MRIEQPFDPARFRRLLAGLPSQQRLAFALARSERLYPNYVLLASKDGVIRVPCARLLIARGMHFLGGRPH